MVDEKVPFQEGQSVESRSFVKGFRGAWFRCVIKEISKRNNEVGVVLIHYDFPDERMRWTKLYQKLKGEKHLTLRPWFPRIYRECELPGLKTLSEVSVVVADTWKVGDEVDWWNADSYWSAKIVKKLRHGKFLVELWPPPHGEGSTYEASGNNFRPSLEWSPQRGWEVRKGAGKLPPIAHVLFPLKGCVLDESKMRVSEISVLQRTENVNHDKLDHEVQIGTGSNESVERKGHGKRHQLKKKMRA